MEGVATRPEPVTRYRWASTDPDTTTEYLRETYTDLKPAPIDPQGFTFWTEVAAAGPLVIGKIRHSGPLHAWCEPPESLVVVQTLAGGPHHVRDGEREVAGPLKLTPTWSPCETGWDDVTVLATSLHSSEVARVGASYSGLDPASITFSDAAPVSAALAGYWSRLSNHLHDEVIASDALMAEPLVRANVFHQLASALLATFPNTALAALTDPLSNGGGGAEPATVRRAVDFMDAHAHEDVGLTEIAEAARIGARSLQLAFRRHRDMTPLEYLRRVRLEHAHRDLRDGDPTRGDRVETIAARWGFAHPGRFSVVYREHYGRSPSATLRQ
jgi:AraC-like DNA-binding protein